VIGSAGSNEKCAWLRNVAKVDVAVNYRDAHLRKSLKEAAPNGIDVYFDNVGGEQLNAALPRTRPNGRIGMCGMISAYNNEGAMSEGVVTLPTMMHNRISMRAYIWQDHIHLWPQFLTAMRGWLGTGAMLGETTVYKGLEAVPEAIVVLFEGGNLGKMLVKLG